MDISKLASIGQVANLKTFQAALKAGQDVAIVAATKVKFEDLNELYRGMSQVGQKAMKKAFAARELGVMNHIKENGGKLAKEATDFQSLIKEGKLKFSKEVLAKVERMDSFRANTVGKEGFDFKKEYSKMFRADHVNFKGNKAKSIRVQHDLRMKWYINPARSAAARSFKKVVSKTEQSLISSSVKRFF